MNAAAPVAPIQVPEFASMFVKREQVGPPKCILLYGEEGTRKTTKASEVMKLPQFVKALYIDIDRGSEVFVNDEEINALVSDEFGAPGEKAINIVEIDKRDINAPGILDYFLGSHDANGFWQKGAAFKAGYDVIILDSLDVAQQVKVDHYMRSTFNEKGQLDTRKAWGEVNKWATDLMWTFQNEPDVLGIVVMHSTLDGEESGAVKIKPKLQGGAKDTIASIPSIVVYLEIREDKATKEERLVATVGKGPTITAKNRYMLPKEIEDFSIPGLYALIEEKQSNTTTKTTQAAA